LPGGGIAIDSPISLTTENTLYLENPIVTPSTDYTASYVDVNPIGLGVEDYWSINTQYDQPQFNITHTSVYDDFSAYESLKFNTGDRFIIYAIDKLDE